MALNEYLAEEIRLDHAEGHVSRREALRLLGLLGLGATSATIWLDGADADAATKTPPKTTKKSTKKTIKKTTVTKAKEKVTKTSTPATPTLTVATQTSVVVSGSPTSTTATTEPSSRAGVDPTKNAVPVTAITFAGAAGKLFGSFAPAVTPKGSVLIIHENRGLTPHFQTLPGRFARDGYSALAIDLASRVGGTDAVAAQMPAPLANATTADLVADMKAGLDELERRTPGAKLAVIGFCFGGGMVWNLLNAGDARIAVAAPFYGVGPSDPDFTRSPRAAVLAVYAELDARVNANRPAMTLALEKAKSVHQILVAPGVDHAFFNDTGARYNAIQAAATYEALLDWFAKHLS